jgi:integrase
VRVGKSTKTFRLVVGTGENRKRYTLGHYPETTLARAREKARDILAQKRLTPTEEPSTPFLEALEQFLDAYRRKNKASTAAETERLLRRYFSVSSDIRAITTRDLTRTIDKIENPSERLHGFVAAKTLFSWFAKQRLIPSSPLAGIDPPHRPQARERVLTDTELAELWRSLGELKDPRFQAICRLLILTDQRLSQIGGLRAEYIDYENQLITWPATEMKVAR